MEYNVDYFIKKFEPIDEDGWCAFYLYKQGKHCANGFCGVVSKEDKDPHGSNPDNFIHTEESISLNNLLYQYFSAPTHEINDHRCDKYPESTPKQRILATLYRIKKLQQPKYEDITKQIANLPIQQDISDLSNIEEKELSTNKEIYQTI